MNRRSLSKLMTNRKSTSDIQQDDPSGNNKRKRRSWFSAHGSDSSPDTAIPPMPALPNNSANPPFPANLDPAEAAARIQQRAEAELTRLDETYAQLEREGRELNERAVQLNRQIREAESARAPRRQIDELREQHAEVVQEQRDRIAEAGLRITSADEAGIRVDAEPVEVGAVAARHGLTLIELRPGEGAGLESLFLELTADTQREGGAA